jgi:hypothetical protein
MASEVSSQPTRFFVMNELRGGHHDTKFSTVEPNIGPAESCPQCRKPLGMLTWQPPYRVELELYGKDFGDLAEGPGGDLLITERFAEDFKTEGLTGFSGFHPVEVTRVRRKRRGPKTGAPPRYLFVLPLHGAPALDMERSRITSKKSFTCGWCRSTGVDAVDGLALEAETWQGEDVFRPRGLWGVIIVSERFMRFAERHATSHLTFVPIEKYVWDPLGLYYPYSVQMEPPNRS